MQQKAVEQAEQESPALNLHPVCFTQPYGICDAKVSVIQS